MVLPKGHQPPHKTRPHPQVENRQYCISAHLSTFDAVVAIHAVDDTLPYILIRSTDPEFGCVIRQLIEGTQT